LPILSYISLATHLDPVQYARVEDVDTGVDSVSNELYGLFDESVDNSRTRLGHDHTISRGLSHLGDHDRTLTPMASVEIPESLERVGTGDVRVEDKEGRVILSEDLTGESQGTGGTERFGLDAEGDGDTVLLLGLLEHGDHDLGSVVDGEDNVLDTGFDKGLRVEIAGEYKLPRYTRREAQ